MSDKIRIYHNPRCSKSRQTLEIIQSTGVTPEIILYLEQPPSAAEFKRILKKLGKSPRDLLRKNEDAYKELQLASDHLSDTQIINAMLANPKLIERPIVIKGDRAVLGRPPENVKALLKK